MPSDFQLAFKGTDRITMKKFLNLPRHGHRAGKVNNNFLNAELFYNAFLRPCGSIRSQVGLLAFEFSRFYPTDYKHGRGFVSDFDKFLAALPQGWPYAWKYLMRTGCSLIILPASPSITSLTRSTPGRRRRR
jgi:hypothetical protein